MPSGRTSLQELQVALSRQLSRENRLRPYERLARRANVDLDPGETWMLTRVAQETSRPIVAMAEASKTPVARVDQVAAVLARRGYVTVEGQTVFITDSGRQVAAVLEAAQVEGLKELLEGWTPHDHPDLEALVAEISKRLSSEDWGMVGASHAGGRRSSNNDESP